MSWRETQNAFAAALRDPDQDVPTAVGPRNGKPPTARFNVYRNNSAVSLTEALADGYPVVHELVGEEFFVAMARTYVADNAPATPVLIHYGATFADFIEGFEPAQSLPFLAEVARVEWMWTQAYHASDQESIGVDQLQRIEPERLDRVRLELHPSLQLIRSEWPAVSIWSAHQNEDDGQRQAALQNLYQSGECGLIVRPEFEVNVQLVEPGVWQIVSALKDGATLSDAATALGDENVEHFGGMLAYVFSTGSVVAIRSD